MTHRASRLHALLWLALFTSLGCQSVGHWLRTPSGAFADGSAPPAPDYSQEKSWAALPWRPSRAGAVPAGGGAVDAQDTARADAFFVHPTTYFWRRHWNGPAGGWLTDAITGATLAGQASAFNGAARIYAPRYRQMTLAGFDDPAVRDLGLELAYGDVRRAFLHYLETWSDDRPLILAGHSQGSRHVMRLLDEFFREGPLTTRLIVAYAVGTRVWLGPYGRGEAAIPVCADPEETGCLVAWRTFAEGSDPAIDDNPGEEPDGPTLCVNPLSWRRNGTAVPAAENLGGIALPMLRGPGRIRPGLTGARCGEGVLWITPPSGSGFRMAHEGGNWHAYDYALFYMNVRRNAERRVEAFLRRTGPRSRWRPISPTSTAWPTRPDPRGRERHFAKRGGK